MTRAYRLLKPNHYLSTHIRLVREWNTQDVVVFSQLVDFTEMEKVRDNPAPRCVQTKAMISSIRPKF